MRIATIAAALTAVGSLQAQVPSGAEQLGSAVLAAPEAMREGAKVLGYDGDGNLVTLRKGTNELVCLADNPANEGWSVACYHSSLEPYMVRGRELNAEGVTNPGERNAKRWEEMEMGTLAKPDPMAVLYVLHGGGFDAALGEVKNPFLRWVFYLPGATGETTGLPIVPSGPGAPWLMFPGTQGAHIMVTPARSGG